MCVLKRNLVREKRATTNLLRRGPPEAPGTLCPL